MSESGGRNSPALSGIKLFIGTPTRGTCAIHFARSLAQTTTALELLGVPVEIHQSVMSCFVDMSRNTLVAQFLKTDSTHLMMIDDDMGWNADAVVRMLLHDVEFIAGAGPKKVDSGDEFCCHINVHADETPIVQNGLISASHVGGAFMLLKRAAIERMIKAYPDMVCRAVHMEHGYRFFETRYTANAFHSEDYLFCDRFTAAGGEIWIYPDVEFTHTGTKDYRGNYHKFLLGLPQVAAEAQPEGLTHSIVIVSYKGSEALDRCLSSLVEHAPDNSEIIIVDNTPTPIEFNTSTVAHLKGKYARVEILQEGINHGFAAGCNIGANLATGQNLIFLNPDTIVYRGWAQGMANQLREGVGAVGPLSNFVCGAQNWVCYAHSAKLAQEDLTPAGYAFAAQVIASAKIHAGIQTKLLIGFCLMVPRKVWGMVGGFDPAFLLGCDDLDYSLRLAAAGYKLIIAPDVFVYHEGHVSFREEGDPALELNRQSEAAMRAKLKKTYGDQVPTSTELWGCEIFPTIDQNHQGMLAYANTRAGEQ